MMPCGGEEERGEEERDWRRVDYIRDPTHVTALVYYLEVLSFSLPFPQLHELHDYFQAVTSPQLSTKSHWQS